MTTHVTTPSTTTPTTSTTAATPAAHPTKEKKNPDSAPTSSTPNKPSPPLSPRKPKNEERFQYEQRHTESWLDEIRRKIAEDLKIDETDNAEGTGPFSYENMSRKKTNLYYLNNRLADYMKRVRGLEEENKHLHSLFNGEELTRTVTVIKGVFSGTETTKFIEDLELETADLIEKTVTLTHELKASTERCSIFKLSIEHLEESLGIERRRVADLLHFEDKFKSLLKQYEATEKELQITREELAKEIKMRTAFKSVVDIEKRMPSLLLERIEIRETAKVPAPMPVFPFIIGGDSRTWEVMLQQTRTECIEEARKIHKKFEDYYKMQIEAKEVECRRKIEKEQETTRTYKEQCLNHEQQIHQLMSERTESIDIRSQLTRLQKEVKELTSVKVQLKTEIAIYRSLLDEEDKARSYPPHQRTSDPYFPHYAYEQKGDI